MNVHEMTGLALLQAMASGELPYASIAVTIPMTITSVSEGKVVFSAKADDNHLNPLGGVHGGFAATVLDTVTGCAVHSLLDAGVGYGTIDLNIKMIRPIPKNESLIAEGQVINLSKSLGISEGTLKTQAGKLLATATATCMIIKPSN
ncbi:PaaI family thioesterase [Shewanella surugensis]|uniref:PaaI family thioesterase n=1 Tax=Shewanella surugensis TaxID=212020 RepID=A0ABT0LAK7_9GAMM|nr:PaaI family thioesterase [Shewanella surugensis]MCL1124741.1 PaaI family thioesterase [Shewanella surugensis]